MKIFFGFCITGGGNGKWGCTWWLWPCSTCKLPDSVGPVVAWTICPIALELLLSLWVFQEEALYSARLFFFRLRQIVFNRNINGTRLERAFRLMLQTLTSTTTASTTQQEEQLNQDTFNTPLTLTL
ncbi:hypothetical protein D0Y65_028846 [Glycine soja]|uniref:Uncharacterized protein n=1 Tax=Glycine soja TaxID=3848 RepID=A0A445HWG4_GLYSO|nr:hypothetical protein D0Y65_028846 [Glycine soja]